MWFFGSFVVLYGLAGWARAEDLSDFANRVSLEEARLAEARRLLVEGDAALSDDEELAHQNFEGVLRLATGNTDEEQLLRAQALFYLGQIHQLGLAGLAVNFHLAESYYRETLALIGYDAPDDFAVQTRGMLAETLFGQVEVELYENYRSLEAGNTREGLNRLRERLLYIESLTRLGEQDDVRIRVLDKLCDVIIELQNNQLIGEDRDEYGGRAIERWCHQIILVASRLPIAQYARIHLYALERLAIIAGLDASRYHNPDFLDSARQYLSVALLLCAVPESGISESECKDIAEHQETLNELQKEYFGNQETADEKVATDGELKEKEEKDNKESAMELVSRYGAKRSLEISSDEPEEQEDQEEGEDKEAGAHKKRKAARKE